MREGLYRLPGFACNGSAVIQDKQRKDEKLAGPRLCWGVGARVSFTNHFQEIYCKAGAESEGVDGRRGE